MSEFHLHLSKRLSAVQLLSQYGIVSRKMMGILKNQLIRGDENLNFIFNQFETKELYSLERFLNQLNGFLEKEIEHTYNQLYSECSLQDAKAMSKQDRKNAVLSTPASSVVIGDDVVSGNPQLPSQAVNRHEMSLTYGEIEYKSFYDILRKLDIPSTPVFGMCNDSKSTDFIGKVAKCIKNNDNGLIFYDLGHGTGRAVFVASLMHDFKCCKGIELLDSLYNASVDVHMKFKKLPMNLNQSPSDCVKLIHGSIVDDLANDVENEASVNWWDDGDVIFANSTCFDATLMEQVSQCARRCKPGAIIITFTKSLNYTYCAGMGSSNSVGSGIREGMTKNMSAINEAYRDEYSFELLDKLRYRMSWGPATVYIHRKLENSTLLPPVPCESPYAFDRWKKCILENLESEGKLREVLGCVGKTGSSIAYTNTSNEPSVRCSGGKGLDSSLTALDGGDMLLEDTQGDLDAGVELTPASVVPGGFFDSVHTNTKLVGATTMGGKKLPHSLRYSLYAPCTYTSSNYSQFNVVLFLHGANGRGKSFEFCKTQGLLKHLVSTATGTSQVRCGAVGSHGSNDKDDDWEMLYGPTADGVSVLSDENEGGVVLDADAALKSQAILAMESNHCIVLAPICPSGYEWKHEHICKLVISLLDFVLGSLFINTESKLSNRVYLTGYSMGGLGCWMLSSRYRNRFRAVVPICGGGNPVYACLLANMPM